MNLKPKNIRKKSSLASAVLIIAVVAMGAVSTIAMRSSFSQNAATPTTVPASPFDQFIMNQAPSLAPLVQKAMSPAGNASLSPELADIVSTSQLLASKELAAANNASTAGKPFAELRYANAALDVDKHILNLVTQYEWDVHQGQQAK